MTNCRWILLFGISVACSLTAQPPEAAAIGYYNLPGSFYQCFGYGNGAGHHACLVLGPKSHDGYFATNEVRLPCAPLPPCDYYQCEAWGPSPAGNWLEQPSSLLPTGPRSLPAPSAVRPQFYTQPAGSPRKATTVQ